jgi:hypothetical protein
LRLAWLWESTGYHHDEWADEYLQAAKTTERAVEFMRAMVSVADWALDDFNNFFLAFLDGH